MGRHGAAYGNAYDREPSVRCKGNGANAQRRSHKMDPGNEAEVGCGSGSLRPRGGTIARITRIALPFEQFYRFDAPMALAGLRMAQRAENNSEYQFSLIACRLRGALVC